MGTYTKEQLTAQLERIQTAAASTRTAIINKGISFCPADAKLADLAYYAKFLCDFPDIRLDYLQADETPSTVSRTSIYFNTGYYPDSSTNIEISYQNTLQYSSTTYSYSLIGCTHTTGGGYSFSGDHYIMAPGAVNSTAYAFRYRNNSNFSISSSTPIDTNKHTIISVTNGKNQSVYYDGTLAASGTTSTLRTFELPLYIFSDNTNGNAATYALKGTRIFYIKIWKDNNLVRFYVPVLHYYNGQYTPCFYDKVNDNYIYNLGTGTVVYSRSEDIMLDYIYVPTSNRGVYYNTNWPIELHQHMDLKYISGNVITGGNINEGPMLGSTYNGTYKYGIYAPAAGAAGTTTTVKNGFKIPRTSSTVQLYGPNYSASDTSTHAVSVYSNSSNYRCMYDNSTLYTSTNADQTNSIMGTSLGIFGGTSATTGSMQSSFVNTKIFYACVNKSDFSTGQSWIPVLHNNIPSFYNLTNQTYITNSGSQTPGYLKLN